MLNIKFTEQDWDRVAVTADTHAYHKNMVKGCSNWKDTSGCRDFPNQDAHMEAMIEGINATVPKDGILINIGDWSFRGLRNVKKFRFAIQAKEVHLIMGNHDDNIRFNKDGCREAFTTVNEKGYIQIENQRIILDHYAHRIWRDSHKGSWMLYGHSHGNLEHGEYMNYKTMDIGLDNHPEFRPFTLREIKAIMDKREIIFKDHHK